MLVQRVPAKPVLVAIPIQVPTRDWAPVAPSPEFPPASCPSALPWQLSRALPFLRRSFSLHHTDALFQTSVPARASPDSPDDRFSRKNTRSHRTRRHLQEPQLPAHSAVRSSNRLGTRSPITARAAVPTLPLSAVARSPPFSLPIEPTLDAAVTTLPRLTSRLHRPPCHEPLLPLSQCQPDALDLAAVAPTAACPAPSPRLPTPPRALNPQKRPP